TTPDGKPIALTVVGVVGHAAHEGLDAEPRVQYYLPYAQNANPANMTFVVRTAAEPMGMLRAVAGAVHAVDKDLPLAGPRAMDDLIEASVGQRRVSMLLL